MSGKLLVFLRAHNDIDHIVPILFKWLQTEDVPVDIVVTTDRGWLDDPRIGLLRRFRNLTVYHLGEFAPLPSERGPTADNARTSGLGRRLGRLLRRSRLGGWIAQGAVPRKSQKSFETTVDAVMDRLMGDVDRGLVLADWTFKEFGQRVTEAGRARGFTSVSLPHGDAPYWNRMEHIQDIDYGRFYERYSGARAYDYVVVPNMICAAPAAVALQFINKAWLLIQ